MNLQKLNENFILLPDKKLMKNERVLLKSFANFKVQLDSDNELYKKSRKNVLAILNKLINKKVHVKTNNGYTYFFLTPKKRRVVDYKSVVNSLANTYSIPMHYIDEVKKDNTTVTFYDELNIRGDE
tara:strand:+ start:180 stop:557 length:378 start_codon:yes stop_codon:yes gene_type:complete